MNHRVRNVRRDVRACRTLLCQIRRNIVDRGALIDLHARTAREKHGSVMLSRASI